MYSIGIDVAKHIHKCVCLDNEGEKLGKPLSFSNTTEGYQQLLTQFTSSGITPENSKLGLEATGNYWENLYAHLTSKGFQVIVLNPYQTNKYRQALMKKAKTDDIDALVIAGLIRSGDYAASFLPEETVQTLREITKLRYGLIKDLKDYQRQAEALLSLVFPEYQQSPLKNPFAVASLSILKTYPTAKHLAGAKPRQIEKIVRSIQGNNFNTNQIDQLVSLAKDSVYSGRCSESRAQHLRMLLSLVGQLQTAIKDLDQQIEVALAPQDQDNFPGSNLLTIPGVGKKTLAAFLSVVGTDGATFSSADKLIGYIGFFPQIYESGQTRRDNTISSRGPRYIKWALYNAGVACLKHNQQMKTLYHRKLSQGKAPKQAIIYVVKKLAQLMLSMLKSGQPYDPARVFAEA
jgi:transposase